MSAEKEQLLREFGIWISFVTDLGKYDETIWDQHVDVGKWTLREITAHILRWDDYFFEAAIAKIEAGLPLTLKLLNFDEFNEEAKKYAKTIDLKELSRQAVRSRKRIIDTIASLQEEQYKAAYQDADGLPFIIDKYLKDFFWHDQHHIEQMKHRIHFRIEEMSFNGWPALQTVLYDGWLLRFAEGYTKRSNSIQAIYGNTLELEHKIRSCERLYQREGTRTVFKMTPFIQPASLDEELALRGYELLDPTLVKTLHLDHVKLPNQADIWMDNEISEAWLDTNRVFNRLTEEQSLVTQKMLEYSPLEKCFAILHDNGIPVASGLAVIEDGWIGLYDIVTDSEKRNRGYGEQLILHILQWGKSRGAKYGYLQVVKNNAPANRLYEKIGYELQYEYWYRAQQPNHIPNHLV
ncbi:GNAT superfamily N-acetyltransferase [Paenibacillus castaneae]|uniref:GNAT family N-acetyltransferase n=1 Tax=Paenibacillus castaneae TaxID=474957 RepID=UPI00141B5B7C|nr:GNAT family N-acetyltransferase [Paenibacillus castaneae]NIK77353.1 GNAT superfamily N-acetyltransferase [Paenibacillus castaneae]